MLRNESKALDSFAKILERNGWFYRKIMSISGPMEGMPDCFFAKHGTVVFAEAKYARLDKKETRYHPHTNHNIKLNKQMTNLIQLARHCNALYLFFFAIKETKETLVCIYDPVVVMKAVKEKKSLPCEYMTLEEAVKALEN